MGARPIRKVGCRFLPVSRTHHGHPERSEAKSRDPEQLLETPDLPTGTGDFWVYILTNQRRTVLYIGVTNGLLKRVSEHSLAGHSSFARRYHVSTLIYYENFNDPRDAIDREKQLKRWSRLKKETLIGRFNPGWIDLGVMLRGDGGHAGAEKDSSSIAPGPSTAALRAFAQDDLASGA